MPRENQTTYWHIALFIIPPGVPKDRGSRRSCRVRRGLYAQEFPARGDEGTWLTGQEQRIEGRCQSYVPAKLARPKIASTLAVRGVSM